jgi:hypothetical protein
MSVLAAAPLALDHSVVRSFLESLVPDLDADARRAMYAHRLLPGARALDPRGREIAGLEGARWSRRPIVFGPREPLTLLDRHGRELGGIDPTPEGWVAWSAALRETSAPLADP